MHSNQNPDSPKVSVVVPCYKQAQYLDECLESVLNQSFQFWDCIIVDDGSPDNTIEVVRRWMELDKRFKLISINNSGVSNARNVGIKSSDAALVLPLDGDDKIAPLYLEKAVNHYMSGDYAIIYCEAEYFGNKTGRMLVEYKSFRQLLLKNEIFVSALFSKNDFLSVGGFDTKMDKGYEDWEFWINLLISENGKVKQIDYGGFFYRIKEKSRNVKMLKNKNAKIEMTNYIYEKHNKSYKKYFGHPLENIQRLKDFEDLKKVSSIYSLKDLFTIVKIKLINRINKTFR
jgi:glycosyltransferase involved in cell wall biosynthesis